MALARVDRRHAGAASGILKTVLQMGSAFGIALVGSAYHGVGISDCVRTGEDAAEKIVKEGLAKIVILGDPAKISAEAVAKGVNLAGVELLDPKTSPRLEQYVADLVELRKSRGLTPDEARKLLRKLEDAKPESTMTFADLAYKWLGQVNVRDSTMEEYELSARHLIERIGDRLSRAWGTVGHLMGVKNSPDGRKFADTFNSFAVQSKVTRAQQATLGVGIVLQGLASLWFGSQALAFPDIIFTAIDDVVPGTALQDVLAVAARDRVIAITRQNRCRFVVSRNVDRVVARPRRNLGVGAARVHRVVAVDVAHCPCVDRRCVRLVVVRQEQAEVSAVHRAVAVHVALNVVAGRQSDSLGRGVVNDCERLR